MRRAAGLVCALAMLCGCNFVGEWEQNPALVRSKANLAGGAVVYAYLAVKPEAKAGAAHLREVVQAVKAVVASFPDEGFMVFLSDVNKKLERVMTGDAAAFLPSAKLLASVLLETLQQKADRNHWFDDKEAVTGILSSFLSGADEALVLVAYVKPDN